MHYSYYAKKDFPWIEEWLKLRDLPAPTEDETPAIGFIAKDGQIPVCIGFLRRVEGGFAQLDGLITNPKCHGELRSEAIDGIVQRLIEEAKHLNLKGIVSYSIDPNTIERSKKHGFVVLNHKVLGLSMTKNHY